MTLVVNLYGGPGAGKSTTAALTFGKLKQAGANVELVGEFAKDLTWEARATALTFQPYVIGKQMYRLYRLFGQVSVIVTDSPILLGCIYGDNSLPASFYQSVREIHQSWNTLDILLERDHGYHPYNPRGRNQTEEEALAIDLKLQIMLDTLGSYEKVRVDHDAADKVYELVVSRLLASRHAGRMAE